MRHDLSCCKVCQLCQAREGYLLHRRLECHASTLKRLECTSPELRAAAKAPNEQSDEAGEAFAKGLFREPLGLVPAPATSESAEVKWWNKRADGLLTGTRFSDGS